MRAGNLLSIDLQVRLHDRHLTIHIYVCHATVRQTYTLVVIIIVIFFRRHRQYHRHLRPSSSLFFGSTSSISWYLQLLFQIFSRHRRHLQLPISIVLTSVSVGSSSERSSSSTRSATNAFSSCDDSRYDGNRIWYNSFCSTLTTMIEPIWSLAMSIFSSSLRL
jgi:hypothetical protein